MLHWIQLMSRINHWLAVSTLTFYHLKQKTGKCNGYQSYLMLRQATAEPEIWRPASPSWPLHVNTTHQSDVTHTILLISSPTELVKKCLHAFQLIVLSLMSCTTMNQQCSTSWFTNATRPTKSTLITVTKQIFFCY